jgi:hypothetical protein
VAGAFEPAGFGDLAGGVVGRTDEVVGDGLVVEASDCGDEVLDRAGAASGVAADDHGGADVLAELLDLRRGGFVQVSVAPLVDDLLPVGAVGAAAGIGHRRGHDRDVLGEGGCRWSDGGAGE